jgi:hypothetical protein
LRFGFWDDLAADVEGDFVEDVDASASLLAVQGFFWFSAFDAVSLILS